MLAQIGGSIHEGVAGVRRYDPSITSNSQAALTYSGLHAVWCYRISHRLWIRGHELAAQIVCQLGRMVTGVEIHPAATLGKRLLIDHGTGIVIGETAVIGDDVVLYQGVTLGSVENHAGRRHPQLGSGVFVGAGAKILGAIIIGDNAKIGANAVVLHDVPADATAVGVPAHIVGANR
ncbi:serine O-acetyltransferase [Bifidobacterium subtile]|uniref:Serine acetyltransferase n=1 Tax=Bifidobacterium subtile TaxID=77635 RepID=A0A087EBL4_9BIFI|nr:serine O-acetyltransferase [Bifidobacterium subtile]KFJ05165.1 serine acetyltransferase [Bifidobacterium subtile]MCI1223789.1 serine O-acetyltransferase [Bifidobacterium subtile]MCI1242172.1 serine O-acetyltransferase [Bifidobacterium subtile]MCI1258898.1 serine O-acetyltransferase [Bifidobacterium subtile]QOL36568.1 serine O-acetyltransferase [Bifidobacterium subtile]